MALFAAAVVLVALIVVILIYPFPLRWRIQFEVTKSGSVDLDLQFAGRTFSLFQGIQFPKRSGAAGNTVESVLSMLLAGENLLVDADVTVGAGNPHATALKLGAAWAVKGAATAYLGRFIPRPGELTVNVYPGFASREVRFLVDARIQGRFRPGQVILKVIRNRGA